MVGPIGVLLVCSYKFVLNQKLPMIATLPNALRKIESQKIIYVFECCISNVTRPKYGISGLTRHGQGLELGSFL